MPVTKRISEVFSCSFWFHFLEKRCDVTSGCLTLISVCFFPSNTVGGGGLTGGFKPPASRTLSFRFPPCIFWLPPLFVFSIAKYCAMLRNFSLFLPLPATLGILLPTPSSPASRTPPAPFSPGLPPTCPPPPPQYRQCTRFRSLKAM